jgi:S1-C subfamily serine protease
MYGRWVRFFSVWVLIFQAPIFGIVTDWSAVVDLLTKSTVYLETKAGGGCTGFVINSLEREKQTKTILLSAAHCDGDGLYADQTPAKVLFKDTKKDLMVLEVDDLERPALKLATRDPKVGELVASYGYGYALERPMFRVAHISDDKTYIHEDNVGGPFFVLDAAFVGGQSGGPVVNAAGDVVMIVQRASDRVGLGVGADIIKQKTGRFWTKAQP